MKKQYNVVGKSHLVMAKELQDEYGLHYLTVLEVCNIYKEYCDWYHSAGWVHPYPSDVERAFGIELEEYKQLKPINE